MFEVAELGKDYQVELIWEGVNNTAGQPASVTIEINNDIRRKEAKFSSQLGRIVFGVEPEQTKQEAAWIAEKLEYCLKIARLCVVDSNLFFKNGKQVKHTNDDFEKALIQSQKLCNWFADAITEAFSSDKAELKQTTELVEQD
jgi:hypothetical protein